MQPFHGEFDTTIDGKSRILVPVEFRETLKRDEELESLVLTVRGSVVWMYPETYYRELVNREIRPGITPNDNLLDYTYLRMAMSTKVNFDTQGRIVLPEKAKQRSGIGAKGKAELTILGMHDHLELWDRTQWEEYVKQLMSNRVAIEKRADEELKRKSVPST